MWGCGLLSFVRFEVPMMVTVKTAVLWYVMPCCQGFRETCCLHYWSRHGSNPGASNMQPRLGFLGEIFYLISTHELAGLQALPLLLVQHSFGHHTYAFLGAFAKLRKVTISFVMPACLSVRQRGTTRLPLDEF